MVSYRAMFPFNLPGPQFLVFFAILAVILLIALARFVRRGEGGKRPRLAFNDPYQIAFLRGGANEAVAVATFSMLDRGLLRQDGDKVVAASATGERIARHALERRLLGHFASRRDIDSIRESSLAATADAQYVPKLEQLGLLPDSTARRARFGSAILVSGVLLAVAATKTAIALAAGRHNVVFLIVLSVVAIVLAFIVNRPRLTAKGKATLQDLRTLFRGLHQRVGAIRRGGGTADAVMAAAVFGLGVLPLATFPYLEDLRGKSSPGGDGGSSSSGCGSSDGGSSCGGGGGCGGCGS